MNFYETIATRVIRNINNAIKEKKTEIWVRRDQIGVAETEFQRQIADGKIVSATFRPDWSCQGSANFLVEYPS